MGWFNPMKHYKFLASVFLTTLMYILGSIYVNKRVYSFHWWENVVLIVISFATVCWFIDISANAAEGILTSYLTEYRLGCGYGEIRWAEQVPSFLYRFIQPKFKMQWEVSRREMGISEPDLHSNA